MHFIVLLAVAASGVLAAKTYHQSYKKYQKYQRRKNEKS